MPNKNKRDIADFVKEERFELTSYLNYLLTEHYVSLKNESREVDRWTYVTEVWKDKNKMINEIL